MQTYQNNDDLWALAFLFEDMSVLAAQTDAAMTTFELLGAAETFRKAISSPRSVEQEADLAEQVAEARQTLSEEDIEAATQLE